MDPSAGNENTISSIAFRQRALLGNPVDNITAYDKAEAFIVRLQKKESPKSGDRLVSLLSTLFVSELAPAEKNTILSRDYDIPVTEHMERMVANMCNYSSYVRNQGMQQGMLQGMQQKEISNIQSLMNNLHMTAQQAMDALSIPPEDQAKYAAIL